MKTCQLSSFQFPNRDELVLSSFLCHMLGPEPQGVLKSLAQDLTADARTAGRLKSWGQGRGPATIAAAAADALCRSALLEK